MPSKEKNWKSNGDRLRKLRVKLGITRETMAERLGMEPGSYKLVELGYSNLGRKKMEIVERWETGDMRGYGTSSTHATEIGEENEPWNYRQKSDLDIIAGLLLDTEAAGKIAEIARITDCDIRTAARKFIEINLEKKRG